MCRLAHTRKGGRIMTARFSVSRPPSCDQERASLHDNRIQSANQRCAYASDADTCMGTHGLVRRGRRARAMPGKYPRHCLGLDSLGSPACRIQNRDLQPSTRPSAQGQESAGLLVGNRQRARGAAVGNHAQARNRCAVARLEFPQLHLWRATATSADDTLLPNLGRSTATTRRGASIVRKKHEPRPALTSLTAESPAQ